MAAQKVPGVGVSRFERRTALNYLQLGRMNAMVGEPNPDRLVGEQCTGRESKHQYCHSRRALLECWLHRAVMSYDSRCFRKVKFKYCRSAIARKARRGAISRAYFWPKR